MKKILVGLSNHHVHLTKDVCDVLFGKNYDLTIKRELKQLNQFASEEVVDVYINNYLIPHVRIIGPFRNYVQLELLESDCDKANIDVVYSDSGKLDNTYGFKLVGPCGEYDCTNGAFVAYNHIHMSKDDLDYFNVNNGKIVDVKTLDNKIIRNVKIKSDDTCKLEFHLNKDEGERLKIKTFDEVEICLK